MHPSELPIRNLILKRFLTDPNTFQPLDDRDYFTTALNRYVQRYTRDRDMYRETLDDLVNAVDDKRPFSRFPPKHRHEGRYYTDCWREGMHPPSRLELYRLRTPVLWELSFCGIVQFPHWPWQRIVIINHHNLKRLRALIGEFEDRCLMEIHYIESRIEYAHDDILYMVIEHTPRGEPKTLRTLTTGKIPQQLFECLFNHDGIEMTIEDVYTHMKAEKKDRRFARWRDELGLDKHDMSKYFHWKNVDTFVFSVRCFQPMGRDENTYKYPFVIPKPSKIERISMGVWFRSKLLFMGAPLKIF